MQIRRVERGGRVFRIPSLPVLKSRQVEVDGHAEGQVHKLLLKLQEWLVRKVWESLNRSGEGCQGVRQGRYRGGSQGCVEKTSSRRHGHREQILAIDCLQFQRWHIFAIFPTRPLEYEQRKRQD